MLLLLALPAGGLLAAAAATDILHRRIPNAITLALAAVGVLRLAAGLIAAPGLATLGAAVADIAASAALFAGCAVLFHLRALGGGDVKLLAAGALVLGAASLPAFLLATVLAGGLLALGWIAAAALGGRPPRGELPYGVAIAAGGILTLIASGGSFGWS